MHEFEIRRRRLLSQRLIGAALATPSDAVHWLGAVQAQDFAGAKWALGMRLKGATDASVEKAFAAGAILRTHLLRPTWHFVTPADIRWLLALTAPRVHAANASMYRKLGLDRATFKRSAAALARTLEGGQHRTRDELRHVLRRAKVSTDGELRMGYIMMHAELDGLVCSGPRRGKQFTYALLDEKTPPTKTMKREEALAELVRWFFTSRGPATMQDFAKWSGLTVAEARTGIEGVSHNFESEVVNGKTYWFAPYKGRALQAAPPAAHLLSIYDEYISGYKDRSAIVNAAGAAKLSAMGNALSSIIVVDGRIVGAWKRRFKKGSVAIRTETFQRLSTAEKRAVDAAIETYSDFLGMTAGLE